MLFASLINHLTVQQIQEPHGNLISHSKGEEEESSRGNEEAARGGVTLFCSSFPPMEHWIKVCGGSLERAVFISLCSVLYLFYLQGVKAKTKPVNP